MQVFNEILKFDYILNNRDLNIPSYFERRDVEELINKRHDFLKDEENLIKYLPQYKDMATRKLINKVHFEAFDFNIINFINHNYSLEELNGDKTILLFIYKDNKVLNKCEVKDITEKINKI